MSPIFEFSGKSPQSYTTKNCRQYLCDTKLEMVNRLLELILQDNKRIESVCSDESDPQKKLLHLFLSSELFSTKEYSTLLTKYAKIPKDTKNKIKDLATKLHNESNVSHLTQDDISFFQKCMSLFIPNERIINPQRHLKSTDITDLKKEKLIIQNDIIPILLPHDWNNLVMAMNIITAFKSELREILTCADETVRTLKIQNIQEEIHRTLKNEFIAAFCQDLIKQANKLGELIIVPNDWQKDSEIIQGLIVRDKAHERFDGFAIILSSQELDMLVSQDNQLPLHPIYKISTIMHPTDFTDNVCNSFNRLVTKCCEDESSNLQLREITLRQCFSAGRRNPETPDTPSKSEVQGSPNASPEDLDRISKIITHAPNLKPEELRYLFELQTRAPQRIELPSTPANSLEKLISTLKDNTVAHEKIPNLIVKAYFGPLSPYPANIHAQTFFPGNEKPMPGIAATQRFYKAARYIVFDSPNQEENPPTHIKRHK